MQIKKELLLFCLLILFSAGLLIASNISEKSESCTESPAKPLNCCQDKGKSKAVSPWYFITGGILHLSV
jgi:hypothetical protein